MWDFIKAVSTSVYIIPVLIFTLIVLLTVILLVKKGLISINTKAVKVGTSESERAIIRQQIEWVHLHCDSLEKSLPHPQNYDIWRGKYILERMYDEIVDWITFNHICTSEGYISIKQERIWATIQSLVRKEEFSSPEFKEFIYNDTEYIIRRLVHIRQVYNQ